jgi:hypothetical protein
MNTIAKHWINGQWTGSGSVLESINPADDTVLGDRAVRVFTGLPARGTGGMRYVRGSVALREPWRTLSFGRETLAVT